MEVKVYVDIDASAEDIWAVITDIEGSCDNIEGIQKIEILERPTDSFVGLKWRETRVMFGKEATEVMWITEAVENKSYSTRAESHGAVYITKFAISPSGKGHRLTMIFEGQAQTFIAKVMNVVFGHMMKNATRKALLEDLNDIKKASEKLTIN